MIDAKQLRIGNLLFDNGKGIENPRVITVDDAKYIELFSTGANTSFCKEHSYIPLTKEWLGKLGFYVGNSGAFRVYGKEEKTIQLYLVNGKYEYNNLGLAIEFVHQIQNLYFALTGWELIHTPYWIRELYRADRHILEGRSYLAFRKDASHEAFSTPMEYHVDYWEELTKEQFYIYLESGQYKLDYNDEGDIFYKLRP